MNVISRSLIVLAAALTVALPASAQLDGDALLREGNELFRDGLYRAALLRKRVLREIRLQAGEQLDPVLAKRFVTLDLREYDRLVARHEATETRAA